MTEEQQIKTQPQAPCTAGDRVQVVVERCVLCKHFIIWLEWLYGCPVARGELVYPLTRRPPSLSPDIPSDLREAYLEAWDLALFNERATAVMARRALQLALRKEGFEDRDLYNEIEKAKDRVSDRLRTKLHFVRQVGLIGAHPLPEKGVDGTRDYTALLDVEPGEVEALFAALDEFFDEFYVRPRRDQRQLDALNEKLKAAGKAPIAPAVDPTK